MRILTIAFILFSITCFSKTIEINKDNFVSLIGPMTMESTLEAGNKLHQLCSEQNKDLFLVLNTPGGAIMATSQFIEQVKSIPCKVHTISIVAMSCGYFVVQSLGTRYIVKTGMLMRHRPYSTNASGNAEALRSLADSLEQVEDIYLALISNKTGESIEEISKSMRVGDTYYYGKQAIKKNQADEIIDVKCGKELSVYECPLNKDIFLSR